jgi:hypothetical protein
MASMVAGRRWDEHDGWPDLRLDELRDTVETLHRWLQVIGKVRLELAPPLNHWWHVTLYLTARGFTTSPVPSGAGASTFAIEVDLVDHRVEVSTSEGARASIALREEPVADFYAQLMAALDALDIHVAIWPIPVEVEDRTPLDEDRRPRMYVPEQANRLWRAMARMEHVFQRFRGRFLGKVSPVHLFWGGFDLATTRFSGRTAPPHPGAPNVSRRIAREAYSHEVSSAGFWPGGAGVEEPAFYAYAYPEPAGFAQHPIEPRQAYYHPELRELILPYSAVYAAHDPDATLMEFLQTSYEAAAELGGWDREALERHEPFPAPASGAEVRH